MQWIISDNGHDAIIYEYIREKIKQHRLAIAPPEIFDEHQSASDYQVLDIYLKDTNEDFIGGLIGATYWEGLEIDYLWVDPDWRNQGLGYQLIDRAIGLSKERGCTYCWGQTWERGDAYRLYERIGGTIVGKMRFGKSGHTLLTYRLDF